MASASRSPTWGPPPPEQGSECPPAGYCSSRARAVTRALRSTLAFGCRPRPGTPLLRQNPFQQPRHHHAHTQKTRRGKARPQGEKSRQISPPGSGQHISQAHGKASHLPQTPCQRHDPLARPPYHRRYASQRGGQSPSAVTMSVQHTHTLYILVFVQGIWGVRFGYGGRGCETPLSSRPPPLPASSFTARGWCPVGRPQRNEFPMSSTVKCCPPP